MCEFPIRDQLLTHKTLTFLLSSNQHNMSKLKILDLHNIIYHIFAIIITLIPFRNLKYPKISIKYLSYMDIYFF